MVAFSLGEKPLAVTFALLLALIGGIVATLLHRSSNICGHWLERSSWFHVLRYVHYIHHTKPTRHNYAVLWLMGTLVLADGQPPTAPAPSPPHPDILRVPGIGGLVVLSLGLGPHHRDAQDAGWAVFRGPAAVLVRVAAIAALLAAWRETQTRNPPAPAAVGVWDVGHAAVALAGNPAAGHRAVLWLQVRSFYKLVRLAISLCIFEPIQLFHCACLSQFSDFTVHI